MRQFCHRHYEDKGAAPIFFFRQDIVGRNVKPGKMGMCFNCAPEVEEAVFIKRP